MKTRKRAGNSTMFLLELILSIMIFAVASAVCLQFFVHSHNLSKMARHSSEAVSIVTSSAELAQAGKSLAEFAELETLAYKYSQMTAIDGKISKITVFFDENFKNCPKDAHVYELNIEIGSEAATKNKFAPTEMIFIFDEAEFSDDVQKISAESREPIFRQTILRYFQEQEVTS